MIQLATLDSVRQRDESNDLPYANVTLGIGQTATDRRLLIPVKPFSPEYRGEGNQSLGRVSWLKTWAYDYNEAFLHAPLFSFDAGLHAQRPK